MTARENARLVLHAVSAETATGRAARRAAEDVLRLENVRAASMMLLDFEYPQSGMEQAHPTTAGARLWMQLRRTVEASL